MYRKIIYFYNRRWWFDIVELGSYRQSIDVVIRRKCKSHSDAKRQAKEALAYKEEQLRKAIDYAV